MMKHSQIEICRARPAASPSRMGLAQAIAGHTYDVSLSELTGITRGNPRTALARQMAMYLAHVVFGMNLAEIGRAFGRDRSTAAHAVHLIEDLRDDPELDRTIGWMESLLHSAAGIP